MQHIREQLAAVISDVVEEPVSADDIEVPDADHGDFAYPAMRLAAATDSDPRSVAENVRPHVEQQDYVDTVTVAGPGYLNITLDRDWYAREIVETLQGEHMGVPQRAGSLLLEFSSPNVAKPMHVGHFRNNALGDSLRRILSFAGYDVTADNWIGDWGTQYGKLIYAFKEYGSEDAFEENPMEHLYELYVRFHEEMDDDAELEEKGRAWAQRIEEGDDEAVELWERFRAASIAHHEADYERMGVEFDRWTGEARYVDRSKAVLQHGIEQGVFTEDADGSVSIEFADEDLPSIVVQKADGTTLYLTRDLATLQSRNEDGFAYNLYVVGAEQELHFKQLFAAADMLGYDTSGCEHVSYGLLDLPEGSMSSREGRIIRLSDLLDEAVDKAAETMAEEDRVVQDPDAIAEAVGIGAVKYANLCVTRTKNIQFEWDRILSFDGESGPYLQYANTRAKSILEKADDAGSIGDDWDDKEFRLLKQLSRFPGAVDQAARGREPATLAHYLTDLCDTFNSFYHSSPVLDADEDARTRRLLLVDLFVQVTDQGLELLGIQPLDEM